MEIKCEGCGRQRGIADGGWSLWADDVYTCPSCTEPHRAPMADKVPPGDMIEVERCRGTLPLSSGNSLCTDWVEARHYDRVRRTLVGLVEILEETGRRELLDERRSARPRSVWEKDLGVEMLGKRLDEIDRQLGLVCRVAEQQGERLDRFDKRLAHVIDEVASQIGAIDRAWNRLDKLDERVDACAVAVNVEQRLDTLDRGLADERENRQREEHELRRRIENLEGKA